MNQNNLLKKALQDISRSEALSENDIRQKIRLAVSLALKSKDPKLKNFWTSIPFKSDSPTIDEITDYLIIELAKDGQDKDQNH
jgi:hypothetical protein